MPKLGMKKAMKLVKGVPKLLWKRKQYYENEKKDVLLGKKVKTSSGVTKDKLCWGAKGKAVSKVKRAKAIHGKVGKFGRATKQARVNLGIKGFCPVGGETEKGQRLLKEARKLSKE